MAKHSSGDILFIEWKNEKQLYSPLSALSFATSSDDGDQALFLTP